MNSEITRLILVLLTFVICYWAILGFDFERFLRKGRVLEAQIFSILLAMALAYLVVQFIFSLRVFW